MNILTGATLAGVRSFTASSSVGMTLKQEAISHLADCDLPFLAINVVRYGTGLGNLETGQSDYHRDTRGGGSGDYRNFVLAPYSLPEAAELIELGFELSEKYNIGTILHTEAALGQMMEPCALPEMKEAVRRPGLDGTYTNKRVLSLFRDHRAEAVERKARYETIKENEQIWKAEYTEDADYVFVAYGLAGRSVIGAVNQLREEGHKVGYIRPITLWPYPEKAFKYVNSDVTAYISIEENAAGQMVDDIALSLKKTKKQTDKPVYCMTYAFGVPTMKKIKADFIRVANGEAKEVY
jgi:2-oxoglutarate ferredoxin oxidoreductase subunit alpha